MFDLVISGGQVVSPTSTERTDVAVRGEKVVALLEPGAFTHQAKRVIDANGLLVVPGAVDPHTHIYLKFWGQYTQDFQVSTVAAAYGGTTTVIDFAFPAAGEDMLAAIERRRAEAEGQVAIDYSLHAGLSTASPRLLEEMKAVIDYGVPSFKGFTLRTADGESIDDGLLLALLRKAREVGGLIGIHAESGPLIAHFTEGLLAEGKRGVEFFPAGRPNICEAEPGRRAIALAQEAQAALYLFHLSSKEAVDAVEDARRKGLPIYGETCPHYLLFDSRVYSLPWEKAIQFVRFPPIRGEADRLALWQGVNRGAISAIGSDEVSAQLSLKKAHSEGKPFNELPGGMAQVETRLPVLYSEGVAKGLISVNRLVDLVSTGPARIFGLYPQKGTISVGSDADIVLLDPALKKEVSCSDLHMGTDYTIYEGWTLNGYPVTTISKGKVIVDQGQYLGRPGDGRFLRRRIDPRVLTSP